MHRPRASVLPLSLLALLAASPALPQAVTFDLAAGWQIVDVDGNEDVYRSQVDEDDGWLIRSLSLDIASTAGERLPLVDRIRLDVSDLGAAPQSRLRLQALRHGAFDLRVSHFRASHYSALPRIANPFLEDGVALGLHTLDRTLTRTDLDLELLPGRTITPLIGWSRYRWSGPGTTTFSIGGDEFRLRSHRDETVDQLRVGLGFRAGGFAGTIMQGWRRVDATHRTSLGVAAGEGVFDRTLLGRDPFLITHARTTEIEGDAPITTAHVSGRLGERARLTVSFVNAELDSETREREELAGSLVSFPLSRFFAALNETVASEAENPLWRGRVRLEAEVLPGLDLSAGYTQRHREVDGRALISGLYTGTTNFSGADPRELTDLVDARSAIERDEKAFELRASFRMLAPLRFWAAYTRADLDLEVAPSAAEIVVPFGQGGTFERQEDRIEAGVGYSRGGLDVAAEYFRGDADAIVFRTDWADRDRLRLRAGWRFGERLRVSASGERINADNRSPQIDFDLRTDHLSAEIELTPAEGLALRASYGRFDTDSRVLFRRPESLVLEPSRYNEDGRLLEGDASFQRDRIRVTLGVSRFENEGSLPLELTRGWLQVGYELTSSIGAALEVAAGDYQEIGLPLADWDSQRFALLLTWRGGGAGGTPLGSPWATIPR